jgi:hypothetical protein
MTPEEEETTCLNDRSNPSTADEESSNIVATNNRTESPRTIGTTMDDDCEKAPVETSVDDDPSGETRGAKEIRARGLDKTYY